MLFMEKLKLLNKKQYINLNKKNIFSKFNLIEYQIFDKNYLDYS